MMNVAVNVRRLREERAWTQEHLAHAADITVRTVQRVERGEALSAETLSAIAGALDVNVATLSTDAKLEAARKEAGKYTTIKLSRAERGSDLGRLLVHSHALVFDCDRLDNNDDEDALAEFKQLLRDWMDIWRDLEPVQQRDAEKTSLQPALDGLHTRNLVVAGGHHHVWLRVKEGEQPFGWDMICVVVSKGPEPRLFALWDKTKGIS